MITDTDILLELEGTGGIDRFLCTMHHGFYVPKIFAERVMKIIKNFYDVDMKITGNTLPKEKGTFCSMSYNDVSVEIKDGSY